MVMKKWATRMDKTTLQEAADALKGAGRVLVISHIRPDGDAVGSLLGLGLSLMAGGKQVRMALADGVPQNFKYLPGSEQVKHRAKGKFDLICLLDCSDLGRAGEALPSDVAVDLNIDHHITNEHFARINLVETGAVATAEILTELLPLAGLPIDDTVASTLLTGLITDTIGFQTNNMTSKALRLAACLIESGANISELYRKALINRSFEALRFWGCGLTALEREGRMIWSTLTTEDRRVVNYPGRDDADLINLLTSVDQADVYLVFVEQPNGKVKVSWRSQAGFDVTKVATRFGGGGHPSASGAEIEGGLPEVRAAVLAATREMLVVG
jgi:phosphoesterase RecJ-like protein